GQRPQRRRGRVGADRLASARDAMCGRDVQMKSALGTAGIAYAERFGWYIFPVNRDKVPLTPHGFRDATRDPATLKEWARRWPGALVGLATGEISGVVVLDVDVKAGRYGWDALGELG